MVFQNLCEIVIVHKGWSRGQAPSWACCLLFLLLVQAHLSGQLPFAERATWNNHKSYCFSQCFNHQISFSLLGQDILITSFSFFVCELGVESPLRPPHRTVVGPDKTAIAASYREVPCSGHCAQCSTWTVVCRSLNYPTKRVLLQLRKRRFRRFEYLVRGHTAGKEHSWASNVLQRIMCVEADDSGKAPSNEPPCCHGMGMIQVGVSMAALAAPWCTCRCHIRLWKGQKPGWLEAQWERDSVPSLGQTVPWPFVCAGHSEGGSLPLQRPFGRVHQPTSALSAFIIT